MKDKELEQYINGIDFSLITEEAILANVYLEIGSNGTYLATSPYTATNLERLVLMSNAQQLVPFVKTLSPRIVYKRLGSRIMESILKRLFECMYVRGEYFRLEDAVGEIDCAASIKNQDAAHVLREAIMLLSGKKVDKLYVEKYKMVESEGTPGVMDEKLPGSSGAASADAPRDDAADKRIQSKSNSSTSAKDKTLPDETAQSSGGDRLDNQSYAKKKLGEYKEIFMKAVDKFVTKDAYITLAVFLQCVRSQSLLNKFLQQDCCPDNIAQRGYVYEVLPTIASRSNLELMYERIKKRTMALSLNEQSSYFVVSFIRHYRHPHRIYRRLMLDKFEQNSNIVLSLLEALQRSKNYAEVDVLVGGFYRAKDGVFEKLLLGRDEGLDTKYVDVIVQFMRMPSEHSYNVNSDFVRLFKPGWLASQAGRKLLAGFVSGGSSYEAKSEFLNRNIDLLWGCPCWKRDGRELMRRVTKFTEGHARKKAFEILSSFGK